MTFHKTGGSHTRTKIDGLAGDRSPVGPPKSGFEKNLSKCRVVARRPPHAPTSSVTFSHAQFKALTPNQHHTWTTTYTRDLSTLAMPKQQTAQDLAREIKNRGKIGPEGPKKIENRFKISPK